jgi:hypothetical protein
MPQAVFESVKAHLRIIDNWSHVSIRRTTLVDNDKWKSFADAEKKPLNLGTASDKPG